MDSTEEIKNILDTHRNTLVQHQARYGYNSEESIQLTSEFIKELQAVCTRQEHALQEKERKKKDSIRATIQEIVQLSQDLSIQPPMESYVKTFDKTLTEQENELQAVVQMLKGSLQLRDELKEMLNKCYVSENESRFLQVHSADDPELLLKAHEAEVQKWKEFYANNEEIFESIQRLDLALDKWLELEASEYDPGRLWNRGASLLKHEKEKKAVVKAIEKAEAEIKELDAKFMLWHRRSFTVYGIPIMDHIKGQRALAEEKRLEMKKNNKKNQLVERATGTSSAFKPRNASTTRGPGARPPCAPSDVPSKPSTSSSQFRNQ